MINFEIDNQRIQLDEEPRAYGVFDVLKQCVRIMVGLALSLTCLSSASASDLDDPEERSLNLSEQSINSFVSEMCNLLPSLQILNDIDAPKDIEEKLIRYFKVDKLEENYRLEIARHWNEYNHRVICFATGGTYPTEHFFRRSIKMNVQELVLDDYFLVDEVAFPIDMNTLEIHEDGTSSTLLDFIDQELSRPDARVKYNVGQLAGMRDIMINYYGAKRASELVDDDRR